MSSIIRITNYTKHLCKLTEHFIRNNVASRPLSTSASLAYKFQNDKYLLPTAAGKGPKESLLIEALKATSIETAIPLFKALKSNSVPIVEEYFRGLIYSQKDQAATLELLDIMRREFHIKEVSKHTIRMFVLPKLDASLSASDKVKVLIYEAGIKPANAASSVVYHCLTQNDIAEALSVTSEYEIYYSSNFLKTALINSLKTTNDVENFVNFLRVFHDSVSRLIKLMSRVEKPIPSEADVIGSVLFDTLVLLESNQLRLFKEVVIGLIKQGLSISPEHAMRIKEKLNPEMKEDLSKFLTVLSSRQLRPVPISKKSRNPSSNYSPSNIAENLEKSVLLDDTKHLGSINTARSLLEIYYNKRDVQKFEELVKRLEKDGHVLPSGVYAQLTDLYSDDCEKSVATFWSAKSQNKSFVLDNKKALSIAVGLIQKDRVEDALNLLRENPRDALELETSPMYNQNQEKCKKILNLIADKGDPEKLQQFFDTLVDNGFAKPSSMLLGPLVRIHLINNNIHQAVETFEPLCLRYGMTPLKEELTRKLIELEDVSNLQRVVDLSTAIHGEISSLYDLAFAFIQCGRAKQAIQIFSTPRLRIWSKKINNQCEFYYSRGQTENLEKLLEVLKEFPSFSRNILYDNLLLCYQKDGQLEKAIDLWTKMKEEGQSPSDRFLGMLAKFMQERNVEVPFEIPEWHDNNNRNSVRRLPRTKLDSSADDFAAFKKALNNKDMKDAFAAWRNLGANATVALQYISTFVEELVLANHLDEAAEVVKQILVGKYHFKNRTFRLFLHRSRDAGRVDILESIRPYTSKEVKRNVSFDNVLCEAYVNAGRAEECIQKLLSALEDCDTDDRLRDAHKSFPLASHNILESCPELTDKFTEMSAKYAAKNILEPMNVLWMYHFVHGNNEECERIWTNYLSSRPQLMFRYILQKARIENNLKLAESLLELLKTSPASKASLGNVYSCLIDIHASRGQFEDGFNVIQNAVSHVGIDHINTTTLRRIKDGLEKIGKEFPYDIREE